MQFGFPGVDTHPDANEAVSPGLVLQSSLRLQRCLQGIACFMERGAERIADDLKDIPMIAFDGLPQDLVMSRALRFPDAGMLACQPGAAFDIGEEKRDRAGGISAQLTCPRPFARQGPGLPGWTCLVPRGRQPRTRTPQAEL